MSAGMIIITILLILLIILTMVEVALTVLIGYRDTKTREKLFQIQMEQSAAMADMKNPLTFKDIKDIINEIIQYKVINYIIDNGLHKKDFEELSLLMDTVLEDLCTDIEDSIGKETIRQWCKISTEQYLTDYIYRSTQIMLVHEIELRRSVPQRRERQQTKPQTKKENGGL